MIDTQIIGGPDMGLEIAIVLSVWGFVGLVMYAVTTAGGPR